MVKNTEKNVKIKKKYQVHLDKLQRESNKTSKIILGKDLPTDLKRNDDIRDQIERISSRLEKKNEDLGNKNPIESFSSNLKNSLLNYKPNGASVNQRPGFNYASNSGKSVKDFLSEMPVSEINDIFFSEIGRVTSYDTYQKISDMISLVGEGIQVFADNIISPDSFGEFG